MFLADDEEMSSPVYKAFWNALRGGNAKAGEFKRRGKGGKEVEFVLFCFWLLNVFARCICKQRILRSCWAGKL
jgi:hypothetical protein